MAVPFKAKKIFITLDDPEEAENFLRGLIVAQQNNSSDMFPALIEGVNAVLMPYRRALIEQGTEALKRQRAGVVDE